MGRSLRGNVDRNTEITSVDVILSGRSLRGNVDRNVRGARAPRYVFLCRSLRGNVDRNVGNLPLLAQVMSSFPTWERG